MRSKRPRRVSVEERRVYLARVGSDAKWRRPTEGTARAVWAMLEEWPPCPLADLMPKGRKLDGETYDQAALIAKQSLVVALDCAITNGDARVAREGRFTKKRFTKNVLFDALAPLWSRQYRKARRRGAKTAYDMRPETVEKTLRELVVAGIRFDTLWGVVTGDWSRSGKWRSPLNPLFSTRVAWSQKGHPSGYYIVNRDSGALRDFETIVESDGQFRRHRPQWPLLLDTEWEHVRRRSVRQEVCAEQPYNVVTLGEGSERVLSILEGARVQFNVEVFRDDYETLRDYLKIHPRPSTDRQVRNYRKLRSFLSTYRRVYRQTGGIPIETIWEWDQPPLRLPRVVWIHSRFFRGKNRRYHAANFWPEHVHKNFRERWFSLAVHVPEQDFVEPGDGPYEPEEHVIIEAHTAPGRYIERDIAASQIQTLAVFLGLRRLERLASSSTLPFKAWLARRLWAQHRRTPGGLLAEGYKGPKDDRLIAFVKQHLMRFYGGDLAEIIRECRKDEERFGPGWRTSRGIWAKATIKPGTKTVKLAKSGVSEAVDRATEFFVKLPPWINTLEEFLEACRTLAEKGADGVVFHDPLDGTEIRWNHAQRGIARVGHEKLEVRLPGKGNAGTKAGFVPLPAGTIDRAALRRFLAPCLTHLLDATFSSMVLEGLHQEGITDVIALHDAWLVPKRLPDTGGSSAGLDGRAALGYAIKTAGEPWLRSLGAVYDDLIAHLGTDPTFGPFVKEIRARWHARVEDKNWPKLLSV